MTRGRNRFQAIVLTALAVGAGCGDRAPSAASGGADSEDPEAAERAQVADSIPGGASLEQVLSIKAKRLAAGLVAEEPLIKGTLAEGGRSDHLTVLKAGFCYRILGVAGAQVEDMDLFLYDPNGVQAQQDPAEDRYPTLGVQGELCPPQGGAYRLQVHMYKGGGAYAVRVYRTP